MSRLPLTPSQTVGPFFAPAMLRDDALCNVLAGPRTQGERIRIEGRVLDGDGAVVPDAVVELWQANAVGRYNHAADTRPLPLDPAFAGYGRAGTEEDGRFWFETVRPGRVPYADGRMQAPHIVVTVYARGLLNHAVTRLYFADEASNADDPLLALVPPARRATLIAAREQAGAVAMFRFDIVLQGAAETVFLNL
jgi:protocatechuate 3,4-dioxygenase, alpha subunit